MINDLSMLPAGVKVLNEDRALTLGLIKDTYVGIRMAHSDSVPTEVPSMRIPHTSLPPVVRPFMVSSLPLASTI
ncbi:unnamed protein product [Tenebrio molitor]|nr:unnamed protein product [Tenebrio molitor]